jgi:hypothetical protein
MKTELHLAEHQFKNNTPRIIALGLLAIIIVVLSLTGCSKTPQAGGESTNITGSYTLVSVDGKTVPCTVSHEGTDVTIKSGAMTINGDGTYKSESTFSIPQGRDINRVVEATYTVSGNELTMHWKGAGTTQGTVNSNTFTMNNEGMIFSYRK